MTGIRPKKGDIIVHDYGPWVATRDDRRWKVAAVFDVLDLHAPYILTMFDLVGVGAWVAGTTMTVDTRVFDRGLSGPTRWTVIS